MCGINVIVDKTCRLSSVNIEKMNEATKHRGPDCQKHFSFQLSDCQLFLGHTRLKIIDLDNRSNQPMIDESQQYTLVFNGEIYNHYLLKNQLIDEGCRFVTSSDTEVVLQWLIQKGTNGISDLEGMFAFAFFDKQKQLLFCGRDPIGMKPLYYFENDKQLVISSEIKGIIASQLYQKKLDEGQLLHYLNYRHTVYPSTFFKNILSLNPGNTLTWQANQPLSIASPDFYPTQDIVPISEEALLRQCETLLIESVGNHLVADVPVGLFLSGGVDSTLILSLLNKHYPKQYHSFSIGYKKDEKSFGTKDYRFAPLAAKQYGGMHEEILIGPEVLKDFDSFIRKIDQPIGDSAALLTLHLSQVACKKVGVALSGAGADELFGGYNRHLGFMKYLRNHNTFKKFHLPIKQVIRHLPTGFDHRFRQKFQLYKKFASSLHSDPSVTYHNFASFQVADDTENEVLWEQETDKTGFVNFNMKKALQYDRKIYLPNDILALTDSMSMQSSLEVRMPYLSNDLIKWSHGISPDLLMKHGRKWILKHLLNQYGGAAFANRKKEGFGLPFGSWLRSGYANHLLDFFEDQNCIIFEYLDRTYAQKQLDDHLRHKKDNTLFLWSIITLGSWLKVNFD